MNYSFISDDEAMRAITPTFISGEEALNAIKRHHQDKILALERARYSSVRAPVPDTV